MRAAIIRQLITTCLYTPIFVPLVAQLAFSLVGSGRVNTSSYFYVLLFFKVISQPLSLQK
jgi:hypothetical protein